MKILKTIALAGALALSSVIIMPTASTEAQAGSNGADIALRYVGTNPTKMRRLWCANFMGLIERKAGRRGTGSNLAKSYSKYGTKISLSNARRGDIVVTGRRGGGHVGYYLGRKGNKVQLVSGNTGGRKGRRVVGVGYYATSRILAVVRPSGGRSMTADASVRTKSKKSLKKNQARAIILALNDNDNE